MKIWIFILALFAASAIADPLTGPAQSDEHEAASNVSVLPGKKPLDFTPIDVQDISQALDEKLELELDRPEEAPAAATSPMLVSID